MERQRLARQWCARDGTSMVTTRVSQLGSELDNFGYAEVLTETPPTLFEGTHPLDIAVGDGLDRFVARRFIVAQPDQRVPERGAADGETR